MSEAMQGKENAAKSATDTNNVEHAGETKVVVQEQSGLVFDPWSAFSKEVRADLANMMLQAGADAKFLQGIANQCARHFATLLNAGLQPTVAIMKELAQLAEPVELETAAFELRVLDLAKRAKAELLAVPASL